MRVLLLIACLAAMLLQPACGGEQPGEDQAARLKPESPARIIQPEELISLQDAQSIAKTRFADCRKTKQTAVGQILCIYESLDSSRMLVVDLVQNAAMGEDMLRYQNAASIFAATREMLMDVVPVPGLGEDAFLAVPGIHVLVGEYYLTISFGKSDDESTRALLREAGRLAVQNLEKAAP